MAITGHKTVKEYRRYAGEDSRGARADAAMMKVMANLPEKLAKAQPQPFGHPEKPAGFEAGIVIPSR